MKKIVAKQAALIITIIYFFLEIKFFNYFFII